MQRRIDAPKAKHVRSLACPAGQRAPTVSEIPLTDKLKVIWQVPKPEPSKQTPRLF